MKQISEEDKKLVQDVYKMIDASRGDMSKLEKFYDDNAGIYDRFMKAISLHFEHVAEELRERCSGRDLSLVNVLDVGAGTGLLGEEMRNKGFSRMDALDMSKKMLEESKAKDLYTNFFTLPIGEEATPGIAENSYDAAVATGVYVEGHAPMKSLHELVRIVKPGGFIIFSLNDPHFTMNYMQVMGDVMKDGKGELLLMRKMPYKLEFRNDFKPYYCYLVVFKVL